jgi:hypothetical protein
MREVLRGGCFMVVKQMFADEAGLHKELEMQTEGGGSHHRFYVSSNILHADLGMAS